MSKELDRAMENLKQLDAALLLATNQGVLALMDMTVADFLKTCAVNGIDLTAKCLRPGQGGELT